MTTTKAKDNALLLLAASVISALGWAFWHYLGDEAFNVLGILFMVGLVLDNVRLRRALRRSMS